MNYKGNILFTRWGGMVQLSHQEVSSANSATLDFYLVRKLIKLGYKISVANASKTFADLVAKKEKDWYEHIEILDMPPVTSEGFNYVFCLQGTENFRFGGCKGIPSQLWVYRLLRDCECPFIYVQYDANTPIFFPPLLRGEVCELFGVTTKELLNKNINVAMVGRNAEPLRDEFGYPYLFDNIQFLTWRHDFHAIAAPMVEEEALEIKEDVNPSIAFIGKDRRYGSKGETLKLIGEALSKQLPEYYVDVYGDWKKWLEHKENQDLKNIKFNKKVKGLDKVLNIYNNSEFAVLVCNDFNLLLQQYTIRTYEVIAGGSVPLTDARWFAQWGDIFSEPSRSILQDLCYNDPEEVPFLIKKFKKKYPTAQERISVMKKVREDMRHVLSDAYISSELAMMLRASESNPNTGNLDTTDVLHKLYEKDKNSKFKKKRESAQDNHLNRIQINENPEHISKNIEEETFKNNFCFSNSTLDKKTLKRLFGRWDARDI